MDALALHFQSIRDEIAQRMIPGAPEKIWSEMGRALWAVQAAEGTLLTIVFLLHVKDDMPLQTRESVFTKFRARTAGQLLVELRKKTTVDPSLDVRLEKLAAGRNWLAHRVLAEDGNALVVPEKLAGVLSRIETLRASAFELDAELQRIADHIDPVSGRDAQQTRELSQRQSAWVFKGGEPLLPPKGP